MPAVRGDPILLGEALGKLLEKPFPVANPALVSWSALPGSASRGP
jgi:hypothetical protein